MKKKGVNLKTTNFEQAPEALDTSNARVMSGVVSIGIDALTATYYPPPKDNRGYFHISYQPEVWIDCVNGFSANHLFLYSCCLAKRELLPLADVREAAKAVCRKNKDEGGMLWLARRPRYSLRMSSMPNERQFPAWNEDVREALCSMASKECGTTGRLVFIVYSCKAMLSSKRELDWRSSLEQEVKEWDGWLNQEIGRIKGYFSLV